MCFNQFSTFQFSLVVTRSSNRTSSIWCRGSGHSYAKTRSGFIRLGQKNPGTYPETYPGTFPGTYPGTFPGTFSRRCRTALWISEFRISKGACCCRYFFCCLKSHQPAAAAGQDPEIAFANSFRGPLKKCTNRRPFKLAMQHNFSIFHAVISHGITIKYGDKVWA